MLLISTAWNRLVNSATCCGVAEAVKRPRQNVGVDQRAQLALLFRQRRLAIHHVGQALAELLDEGGCVDLRVRRDARGHQHHGRG
jgi:hypothetical protein